MNEIFFISIVTDMASVRNFEVMSEKFNVDTLIFNNMLCPQNRTKQRNNRSGLLEICAIGFISSARISTFIYSTMPDFEADNWDYVLNWAWKACMDVNSGHQRWFQGKQFA
jgi:hypothetical protein